MGSIPDELLLARIRKEAEARAAAFASLQAALDKATAAFDEKLLVAASKLTTSIGSASALAGTAFRTAVDESSARAEQVTVLRAEFNTALTQANASITETRVAFADATQAFAQQTLTLQTQFNASSAKFTEQITAISTDTSALATRTTTLESQVQTPTTGLLARVSTVETTKVDASGALAQANSAITASLSSTSAGTIGAAVQTEATARANADGSLSSQYVLSLNSNGVVAGMTLTAVNGLSGGTGYTSAPTVAFSGGGGTGAAATATLTGGVVTSVSVTNGGTNYTSPPTVSFTGGGGSGAKAVATVVGGKVLGVYVQPTSEIAFNTSSFKVSNANGTVTPFDIRSGGPIVFGADIQSDDWDGSSAGWRLTRAGVLDAYSGTFRGSLDVGTGDKRTNITSTAFTFGDTSAGHFSFAQGSAGFTQMSVKYGTSNKLNIATAYLGLDVAGLFSVYSKDGTEFAIGGSLTTGQAPLLTWASDTNLYRGSANVLKTDDNLAVAGYIEVAGKSKFQIDGSDRCAITAGNRSIVFNTNGSDRAFIGSDGNLKMNGGDIRKVTSDDWTPALNDGNNTIQFKWDGADLKVKIDSTEFTVTIT